MEGIEFGYDIGITVTPEELLIICAALNLYCDKLEEAKVKMIGFDACVMDAITDKIQDTERLLDRISAE